MAKKAESAGPVWPKAYRAGAVFETAAAGAHLCWVAQERTHEDRPPRFTTMRVVLPARTRLYCNGPAPVHSSLPDPVGVRVRFRVNQSLPAALPVLNVMPWAYAPTERAWVEPAAGGGRWPAPGVLAEVARNRRARRKDMPEEVNDLLEQVSARQGIPDECDALRLDLAAALDRHGRAVEAAEQRVLAGTAAVEYWLRPQAPPAGLVVSPIGPFRTRNRAINWIHNGWRGGKVGFVVRSADGPVDFVLSPDQCEVVTVVLTPAVAGVESFDAFASRRPILPRGGGYRRLGGVRGRYW